MLAYTADFPLDPTYSIDDFLALVRKWLMGVNGTSLTAELLRSLPGPGEQLISRYTAGREIVQFGRVMDLDDELCGGCYRTTDDLNREWIAEAVARRSADGVLFFGTRVYCTSEGPTPDIPPARAPYIMTLIFREFGAGLDAGLKIQNTAKVVTIDDLPLVIAAMSGQMSFHLPVVYVSAADDNSQMVDIRKLGRRLAGRAHVLVEPSRQYSFTLRKETSGANAYAGAVGIYWPGGRCRRDIFQPRDFHSGEQLMDAVAGRIAAATLNKRAPNGCSWDRIEEVIAGLEVNRLKADGSNEVDKYIAAFGAELAASKKQRHQAELEIERLRDELANASGRAAADGDFLLVEGKEQDLYPGERRHLLRLILESSHANTVPDSRRRHLIEDLLQANATESCPVKELGNTIKETLRGYTTLDARTKQALIRLGFTITSDGKHHKLVFRGDDRYTFALSKSGSDSHRGGLNAAAQINKQLV